jgi:putative transposase
MDGATGDLPLNFHSAAFRGSFLFTLGRGISKLQSAELVIADDTVRSVAKTFGVSEASGVRWSQRFRSTASATAKPMRGRRPFVLAGQRAWLLERIAPEPSEDLLRLQAELAERGVAVSYATIGDFIHEEGPSFKKNRIRQRAGSP